MQRIKALSLIWGEATNSKGENVTVRMSTPDGYTLSMHAVLIMAKKILEGNFKPGYQTPSTAYGEDLIMEVPSVQREIIK